MTKGVYKLVFPFFSFVLLCYFWNELYQRPLPSLAKDWMPKPIEEPEVGFFKYIKVLGSGDRYYLLNLNTNRGLVQNVRTSLVPGSYWKNVTINSEGKVTRRELTKSRDTGCIESAVIMRRTGIVMVGGVQADDAQGNFYGNVDLVNCEKKHD